MADEAEASEGKGSKKLVLIIIVLVVLLLAGGGAAAWFLLKGDSAENAEQVTANVKLEAIYVKIRTKNGKPYFIANFAGDGGAQRFLQVYVEARTRDPEVEKTLQKHMPLIVSELQVLFSSQKLSEIQSHEGKLRLQEQTADKIREILKQETGQTGVENVFFTNLVMQ